MDFPNNDLMFFDPSFESAEQELSWVSRFDSAASTLNDPLTSNEWTFATDLSDRNGFRGPYTSASIDRQRIQANFTQPEIELFYPREAQELSIYREPQVSSGMQELSRGAELSNEVQLSSEAQLNFEPSWFRYARRLSWTFAQASWSENERR